MAFPTRLVFISKYIGNGDMIACTYAQKGLIKELTNDDMSQTTQQHIVYLDNDDDAPQLADNYIMQTVD